MTSNSAALAVVPIVWTIKQRTRSDWSGLKSITLAPYRDDMSGRLRIRFEFLAEPGDVNIHSPWSNERLIVPDARRQLLPGEDLAAMIDQISKQEQFLHREVHRCPGPKHFSAFEIDGHFAELILQNPGSMVNGHLKIRCFGWPLFCIC